MNGTLFGFFLSKFFIINIFDSELALRLLYIFANTQNSKNWI